MSETVNERAQGSFDRACNAMAAADAEVNAAAKPKRVKKEKPKSRAQRWADAVEEAKEKIAEAIQAVEELKEVHAEYQEWRDNLPENLSQSALGEKLEAVADIDLEGVTSSLEEANQVVEECENADLPLGFGRD